MSEITPGDLIRSAWLDVEPTPAPEGEAWRTVPVEPTEAMLDAACESGPDTSAGRFDYSDGRNVWQTMLAASPVVPVGVSREGIIKAVRPVLDRHPMIDSSQSHKLDIQAGWVADAILAALRPTDTGWRDIATAPKDNNEFLIGWSGGGVDIGWWNSMRDYVDWKDSLKPSEDPPTHWMPLPPAPTDTGRE